MASHQSKDKHKEQQARPASQQSSVISQQVYGSSKKLQFIGLTSLLSAIDQEDHHRRSTTMSIESLLDSNGEADTPHTTISMKRRLAHDDYVPVKRSNVQHAPLQPQQQQQQQQQHQQQSQQQQQQPLVHEQRVQEATPLSNASSMTTVTCYHAAVAQKSYGSEKRFLCPPPVVMLRGGASASASAAPVNAMTMAVVGENGEKRLEQHAPLDEHQQCTFKYLHVTGTAKAKQFSLRVDLAAQNDGKQPYATFLSNPISIISKPSKKTAKARNVSSCILTSHPVSLFNRINSQTVRTKYMTSTDTHLCAKNSSWTPFDVIVLSQPPQYHTRTTTGTQNASSDTATDEQLEQMKGGHAPLIYGSQIVLRNTCTGLRSAPYIIHKVDKGRIVAGAYGPVSQMQKVALQLASSRAGPPVYLSAMAASTPTNETNHDINHATILDYAQSKMIPEGLDVYEKVDDYLCWTIVGVSTFEYSYYDSQPPQQQSSSHHLHHHHASHAPIASSSSSSSSIASASQFSAHSSSTRSLPLPTSTTSSSSASSSASPVPSTASASSVSSPPSLSLSPAASPRLAAPASPSSSSNSSNASTRAPAPRCITPFPILTAVKYQYESHTLDIVGQHLMQAVPSPKLLDLWLGSHNGPLKTTIQPQPQQPHQTHLLIDLPSTQDLLVANHDRLVTSNGRRSLELPLYLVRQDGVVYHSGKVLYCEMLLNSDAGRWSVVDVKQ
ncbi:hypothetical protein BC940DRAFT_290221 [Gongronella butleri]|nr:hypothetical protein BC940DRAFT_290221 [Gongronella butleri]